MDKNTKNMIIISVCMIIIIAIPIVSIGIKVNQVKQLTNSSNKIENNLDNGLLSLVDTDTKINNIPITNEEENYNDSVLKTSEETEENKKIQAEWDKKQQLVNENTDIVEGLLNKYYSNEYPQLKAKIEESRDKNSLQSIDLNEYEKQKLTLILNIYKNENLSKNEKDACKKILTGYLSRLSSKDDLAKQIEEIK